MIDVFTWLCWFYGVIALLIAGFVFDSQGRRWRDAVEGAVVGACWLLIVISLAAFIGWLVKKNQAD